MKSHWGDNENDVAVDKATTLIIRMLALCEDVLDIGGTTTDEKVTQALNLIAVEDQLIDSLATMRDYLKHRLYEMNK